MQRLISGVPFSDCEFYPCGHVALDALLGYYGYDTPLVLHDQWVFVYKPPHNGSVQFSPRIDSEIQSLRQTGIEVVTHWESGVGTGWKKLKSRVDDERPVAAMLDTFNLEMYYYPGLGHHSGHYVIVDGYDETLQTVHVVDPSWIVRFRGDLPLNGFKDGWGSKHIPQYQWMEFQISEPCQRVSTERVLAALHRNIWTMCLERAPSPDFFVGLNGLKTLAEDLERWKEGGDNKARAYLKQSYDQARSVIIERDGHGRYLKLAADVLGLPPLAKVGEDLRTITQKWIVFRNLCLEGYRGKTMATTLDKLHGRLLEIATLEEKSLARLEEIVTRSPIFC